MTLLLSLDNVCLAYGLDVLLDHVKFQVEAGERVCLIGRNGAGKSSLLKIIDHTQQPDSGTVWHKPNLRLARLAQELPQNSTKTVYEFVADGLAEMGKLLADYHELTHQLAISSDTEALFAKLEELQQAIDTKDGWKFDQKINAILTRLELNPDQNIADLSGGWQRRAALAQALVIDPELILLDEPTNHLDIAAIQWLEDTLLNWNVGLIFITHDRALLQRLATRIVELDRGILTSWPGDYENFLRRKEEMLHAESLQNAEFDKKLAAEEKWIRQGVKARRTRNEGRVRALKELRKQRSARREVQGKVQFQIQQADKSGHMVIEAKNINHSFDQQPLIKNFSLRIMRGDRWGLIGPNGVGKSTLLNILLKNQEPLEGTVVHGTKLEIAYFDQLRAALDLEKTVADNVSYGNDFVEINGKSKHILSYLSDFLFSPKRALTPVKALSGGECNRLLLARLFSKPSNLLIMDEPTNDLDIETLELLEEILSEYKGTLLLVSHDRLFLDNVITNSLYFAGNGVVEEYVGGYQDVMMQRSSQNIPQKQENKKETPSKDSSVPIPNQKKLNYKEQRELEAIPKQIEALEIEQKDLEKLTSEPDFYKQNSEKVETVLKRLSQINSELAALFDRWSELENQ